MDQTVSLSKSKKIDLSDYKIDFLYSPTLTKFWEGLCLTEFIVFLEKKNSCILCNLVFEKKNWNTHALIDLINKTRKDINKGNYAYGVFVDFKIHLIDTVDHLMLLKISEYHGSNEFQIKGSFLISVTERSLFN